MNLACVSSRSKQAIDRPQANGYENFKILDNKTCSNIEKEYYESCRNLHNLNFNIESFLKFELVLSRSKIKGW
jgi:hypothetical protein